MNAKTCSTGNTRGFTLIEMLVVIAIIGLLSALIVPAVSKALKGAQSVKSLSNLRQIGLGIQMYAADHRGKYPYAWSPSENQTWRDLLYPYTSMKDDQPNTIYVSPTSVLPVDKNSTRIATYALSSELFWERRQKGEDSIPPVAFDSAIDPSNLILAADSGQNPGLGNGAHASFNASSGWWFSNPNPGSSLNEPIEVAELDPNTGTEPGGTISYRDRGHAACLMGDGHSQRFKRGSITRGNITYFR